MHGWILIRKWYHQDCESFSQFCFLHSDTFSLHGRKGGHWQLSSLLNFIVLAPQGREERDRNFLCSCVGSWRYCKGSGSDPVASHCGLRGVGPCDWSGLDHIPVHRKARPSSDFHGTCEIETGINEILSVVILWNMKRNR